MTANEYVEGINDLVETGRSDLEAAFVSYGQIADPTVAEAAAVIDRELVIRREFLDGLEALDPPDPFAGVHRVLGDAMVRLTEATEGLAGVTRTVNSVADAEATPEFVEYQAANADGAAVCLVAQAEIDAIEENAFGAGPWVPDDLSLAVRAALGCGELDTG